MKNVAKLMVTLLAVVALAFAANCGGDDGDDGGTDTVQPAEDTTTPEEDVTTPEEDTVVPEEDVVEPEEDVVVDPCEAVECDEGFSCVEGECVADVTDPCEGVECDEGFSCVEGECVEDAPAPCEGVECDEGLICVAGECVEDVPPAGACTNEADMAVLQGDPTVGDTIKECAMGCLGNEDPLCATTCIVDATGLSAGCSECYNGTFMCSVDNCLAQCVADPNSDACVACQAEHCAEDFLACAGIPLGDGE